MSKVKLDQDKLDEYFNQTFAWNQKFWDRLGGMPDVRGKSCLDLGAGVCSLSAELASNGADVLALDPDSERIKIGKDIVSRKFPNDVMNIQFFAGTSGELLGENQFDYIFTRDTFEHIGDLPHVLHDIKRLLRPGGVLYAGFSPLYNSPFGDHGLLGLKFPWAHLILKKFVRNRRPFIFLKLDKINHVHKELNFLNYADYEKLIKSKEFEIISFEVNKSEKGVMRLFSLLRLISKEMFSVNIYTKLRKPPLVGK